MIQLVGRGKDPDTSRMGTDYSGFAAEEIEVDFPEALDLSIHLMAYGHSLVWMNQVEVRLFSCPGVCA